MSTHQIEHTYTADVPLKKRVSSYLVASPHEKKAFLSVGILAAGVILGSLIVGITSIFFGTTVGWIAGSAVMFTGTATFVVMALDVAKSFRAEWAAGMVFIDPDSVQARMLQLNETEEESLAHFQRIKESKNTLRTDVRASKAKRKVAQKAAVKALKKEQRKGLSKRPSAKKPVAQRELVSA